MSAEVEEAIARAEDELRAIESAHLAQLEKDLSSDRATNQALVLEIQQLGAKAESLTQKIDVLNGRIDARPSTQWQSHVGALGIAVVVAALGILVLVMHG